MGAVVELKGFSEFFRGHDFFDPRPSLWYVVLFVFLADAVLFPFLYLIQTSSLVINFGIVFLGLTSFPGVVYGMGEFLKAFGEKDPAVRLGLYVIEACIVIFLFDLTSRSFNNMAVSIGGQLPLYPVMRSILRLADPIAFFSFGVGAIIIRKKMPFSFFKGQAEKPTEKRSRLMTPARVLAVSGYLLILAGLFGGLFDAVALEALIAFVVGLILFAVALLLRWLTTARASAAQPHN